MYEIQESVKSMRKNIHKVHIVRVVNIFIALDAKGQIVFNHMDHPEPITRPQLMKVLENLHKQLGLDYEKLKKTAADPKEAARILHCLGQPIPIEQSKHTE